MSRGDLWLARPADGVPPVQSYDVYLGSATSIKAGEPVVKDDANAGYVTTRAVDVTSGDTFVGVALSDSSDTASVSGKVFVAKANPATLFRGKAKTKASLAQSQKNTNVVIDCTSSAFTVDESTTSNGIACIQDYNSTTGEVDFTIKASVLLGA
jgi:hypothetical protein